MFKPFTLREFIKRVLIFLLITWLLVQCGVIK